VTKAHIVLQTASLHSQIQKVAINAFDLLAEDIHSTSGPQRHCDGKENTT